MTLIQANPYICPAVCDPSSYFDSTFNGLSNVETIYEIGISEIFEKAFFAAILTLSCSALSLVALTYKKQDNSYLYHFCDRIFTLSSLVSMLAIALGAHMYSRVSY